MTPKEQDEKQHLHLLDAHLCLPKKTTQVFIFTHSQTSIFSFDLDTLTKNEIEQLGSYLRNLQQNKIANRKKK